VRQGWKIWLLEERPTRGGRDAEREVKRILKGGGDSLKNLHAGEKKKGLKKYLAERGNPRGG